MKRQTRNDETLYRYLGRFGNPPLSQVEAGVDRAWRDLRVKFQSTAEDSATRAVQPRVKAQRYRKLIAAMAFVAVAFFVVVVRELAWRDRIHAVVEYVDGSDSLYRISGEKSVVIRLGERIEPGERILSKDKGAVLVLPDASRVEMRSQSELALERADDGVRILLNKGGVIVNAAKQHGHLYVQTREFTVSVVGTVFLVNAEEEGSRVAVIQGEVHVQQGTTSRKLLPGQQVATEPLIESQPVSEEIAWSHSASAHMALLQQSIIARPEPLQFEVPLGNTGRFEVVSVRANKSGGFGMRSGTKGRIYTATNIAVRNVIARAYGIPEARLLAGPSWIGAASVDMRFVGGDRFDITATLPEGASVDQVPVMLRALLADRFKLIAHSEIREAPMYALVVARNDGRLGSQLRKASIDCEAALAAGAVIPSAKPGERGLCEAEIGGEILGRGQRLSELARMLSLFAERPVVDRTDLAGGFDFELRFPELNTGPGDGGPGAPPVSGIFPALQEQLGLKLESIRGNLSFIVIDSVEHPTEN